MNVFTFQDYRALLHCLVEERKLSEPGFTYQRLAEAAGVQRAYLSKVLSSQAQLSQDQLYLIGAFFALSDAEAEYMALLLELDRCELPERKRRLLKQCEALRKATVHDRSLLDAYAASAAAVVVHQALRIPRYRKNTTLLQQELRLSRAECAEALSLLQRLGFLRRRRGQWEVLHEQVPEFSDAAQQSLFEQKTKQALAALGRTHAHLGFIALNPAQLQELSKKLDSLEREAARQTGGTELFALQVELVDWRR